MALLPLGATKGALAHACKTCFASSSFKESAALWWFSFAARKAFSKTRGQLTSIAAQELVPLNHIQRFGGLLWKRKQTSFVVKHLSKFRNLTSTIADMSEEQKVDQLAKE